MAWNHFHGILHELIGYDLALKQLLWLIIIYVSIQSTRTNSKIVQEILDQKCQELWLLRQFVATQFVIFLLIVFCALYLNCLGIINFVSVYNYLQISVHIQLVNN